MVDSTGRDKALRAFDDPVYPFMYHCLTLTFVIRIDYCKRTKIAQVHLIWRLKQIGRKEAGDDIRVNGSRGPCMHRHFTARSLFLLAKLLSQTHQTLYQPWSARE